MPSLLSLMAPSIHSLLIFDIYFRYLQNKEGYQHDAKSNIYEFKRKDKFLHSIHLATMLQLEPFLIFQLEQ